MKLRILFLLIAALLLCSCGKEIDKPLTTKAVEVDLPPVQQPYPVSFDGEVFEAAPETVASLSPALTEILWDFCPEKIVGVSDYCDYPAAAAEKTSLGSPAEPDIEAIIALKPELLVISSPLAAADILKIKQAGIRVLELEAPTDFSRLCEVYIKIAMIFDGAVDFEPKVQSALSELETAVQTCAACEKSTFVIVEDKAENGGLRLSPGNTLSSDMLSLFGTNLWADSVKYTAGEDELFELAPEVVFYSDVLDREDIGKVFPHSTLVAVDFQRFERPTRRIAEVLDSCRQSLE